MYRVIVSLTHDNILTRKCCFWVSDVLGAGGGGGKMEKKKKGNK